MPIARIGVGTNVWKNRRLTIVARTGLDPLPIIDLCYTLICISAGACARKHRPNLYALVNPMSCYESEVLFSTPSNSLYRTTVNVSSGQACGAPDLR